MFNNLFLIPFLVSFFLAVIFLIGIIKLFKTKDFLNKNSRTSLRHIHRQEILRFGGVAIILAFALTLLLDINLVISRQLFWVLLLSGGILLFGLFDDLWELSWQKQLIFQVVIALAVFWSGIQLVYVTNPFGGIFLFTNSFGYVLSFGLVVAWILLIINAMNWVDGIDGVSGGITAIGALTIFFVSLRPEVNQPPVGIIAMALLGAMLAFLAFNFNPAKILAGTSGSVFMGFTLAVLALFAGAKIATTLLVLAIPIIDALWVIFERLGSRESIFKPDQRHLHYRLRQLGWSQRKICLFYWLVTGLIAFIALNVGAKGKLLIFLIIVAGMISGYFLIRKRHSNI
jgi:UDP-GlcNAc:undecaprenyl-phosphate/decaprenyl-phosphate GlcNAc-1-phosphate transferase